MLIETAVLDSPEWTNRSRAHRARLEPYLSAHRQRRASRSMHPIDDFLFTYYSYRPGQLERWHPGYGVRLLDAASTYADLPGYVVEEDGSATVSVGVVGDKQTLITTLDRLLRATAGRPAHTGCFGLHEWAMVYRSAEVRHERWPLRLSAAETDEVVDSHRITCTHFDAFRFFTPPASGLNTVQPGPDDRAEFEQPGCLHAGMDLYKHAFRLSPLVSSELVADCFELAYEIRQLDMAASPYDFSDLGIAPVAIETPEGKRAYARAQAQFAERGEPLRQALIDVTASLLALPIG